MSLAFSGVLPRWIPSLRASAITLVVAFHLGGVQIAKAGFDEQIATNTRAMSLANSVTANPPGLLSIHYNPAGLCLLDGDRFNQGVTLPVIRKTVRFEADPDHQGTLLWDPKDDPLAGTEGTNTSGRMYFPFVGNLDFLIVTALGVSHHEPGSPWTFALGSYVPFGVGVVHGKEGDPARFGGKAVGRQHFIYSAPAVAYRLTDTLSLGMTVSFGQSAMSAELDMRSPNDLVALTRVLGESTKDLEIPILSELTFPPPWFGGGIGPFDQVASLEMSGRDDFSPAYNVGLLWEPLHWLSFGAVYQSPIKAQIGGRYKFEYTEVWQRLVNWLGSSPLLLDISGMLDLPTSAVPEQKGRFTSELEFPQRAQFGVMLKPFSRLRLMTDLHWADWSVMDVEKYEFDQDIQLFKLVKTLGYTGGNRTLEIQRHWKDTFELSYGIELEVLKGVALRLGYQQRKSAVPDEFFDGIYALPDMDFYTGGLGVTLKSGLIIDLGFGYLVSKGYRIESGQSSNLNSIETFKPVYNPYAGLDYEQDTKTYLFSVNAEMPLEMMEEMLDHQLEMVVKVFDLLNPLNYIR